MSVRQSRERERWANLVLVDVVTKLVGEGIADAFGGNGVQITLAQDVVDDARELLLIVGHGCDER